MVKTIVSKNGITIQISDSQDKIVVDFDHPNMGWVLWFEIKNGKFISTSAADELFVRTKLKGIKSNTSLDEWLGTDRATKKHIKEHTTYIDLDDTLAIYNKKFLNNRYDQIVSSHKKGSDIYFERDKMYWRGSIEKVYKSKIKNKVIGYDVYIY